MLIVGDREIEAEAVGVRLRSGEDLGALSLPDIINRIHSESENKAL
jgi:threonyl-tRNA synthetase